VCLRRVQIIALDVENSVPSTCLAKLLVAKLIRRSFEVEAFGIRFKCIDRPTLIRIKEAAGTQDQEAIAELRVLLEEIDKNQT
jgi:hypothetical protein